MPVRDPPASATEDNLSARSLDARAFELCLWLVVFAEPYRFLLRPDRVNQAVEDYYMLVIAIINSS